MWVGKEVAQGALDVGMRFTYFTPIDLYTQAYYIQKKAIGLEFSRSSKQAAPMGASNSCLNRSLSSSSAHSAPPPKAYPAAARAAGSMVVRRALESVVGRGRAGAKPSMNGSDPMEAREAYSSHALSNLYPYTSELYFMD